MSAPDPSAFSNQPPKRAPKTQMVGAPRRIRIGTSRLRAFWEAVAFVVFLGGLAGFAAATMRDTTVEVPDRYTGEGKRMYHPVLLQERQTYQFISAGAAAVGLLCLIYSVSRPTPPEHGQD